LSASRVTAEETWQYMSIIMSQSACRRPRVDRPRFRQPMRSCPHDRRSPIAGPRTQRHAHSRVF
jgi:hypothetical protein